MKELKPLTVPLLAVNHYGPEHQKRKAIEEMGELITELEREQDGRTTPEKVITEIADVHLMVRQLMVIYGLDACMKEYDRKQRRLLRRMDKETRGDYRKDKDDGKCNDK
jgi:NTP pyrophosphatase (non-canonical NTP hydrolase)